uniref:Uncharacterized protein n=1 Tax=Anguilla anguilla TaxID=7936 RepID=A0A0E9UIR3_ANGAN
MMASIRWRSPPEQWTGPSPVQPTG